MKRRLCGRVLSAALCMWLAPVLSVPVAKAAVDESASDAAALVEHLIDMADISQGICCVLGCGDAKVALELARRDGFFVHVLDSDATGIETARRALDGEGLHGTRAVAEKSALSQLPYADNLVDLVVAACMTRGRLHELPLSEVLRVLRPGGKAVLGSGRDAGADAGGLSVEQLKEWTQAAGPGNSAVREDRFGTWAELTKPALPGVDDWSHWEHGPDNNPVSTDAVIKAPYMTQWLGTPLYIGMPAITTASAGRIFIAMGHIAHHEREEPWVNTLLARNGYNGTILWSRKLPDGYLAHRSAFIATPDVFYMIAMDGQGVLLLDPQTGEQVDRVHIPGLGGEWKWIALKDGVLFALVGKEKDPAETTMVRSSRTHWSWGELSKGYYRRRVPWGFGTKLLAYDLANKSVRWTHDEDQPVDSRAMVMGGGRLYVYGPDSHVRCLDAESGKVRWTNDDPEVRRLAEEPGRGLGSTPGFRSCCFSLYTPKALFFEAQTRMNVVAVSLEDGRLLWHRKKTTNNPNMIYLDGHLLVGIGDGGSTLVVDPLTGKTIEDLGFSKRSCARLTATPDSLFVRGMPEGLTRYDRKAKKVRFNAAVRPSCNDGVIGANGLLYMGPWLCDCNLSLMGRIAWCSAGDFEFEREATDADRLEVGQGDILRVAPLEVAADDWPTYRARTARNSATVVKAPEKATRIWEYHPERTNRSTAATAAGGLIFLCGNDGKVRALNAATGMLKWSFLTAGPIMQPPTIWNGRAYLGSGDGYIYALEAATGRLLWRFRAAPLERRIPVYGSLCSTWPVNTGVLVEDDVAYAAAGIVDYDGTYVYALDAVTGKIIWQNSSSGHLDKELRKGVSAQGVLTVAGGRLWMPGGNVISPAAYDLRTGEYLAGGPGNGAVRFEVNRGEEIGVLPGNYLMLGGRLRYSAVQNVVNPGRFDAITIPPGKGTGKALPLNSGKIPPAWDADKLVLVDGRKMVPTCYESGRIEQFIKGGDAKKRPKPTWSADWMGRRDIVSLVAAPNAVLAVCEASHPGRLATHWSVFCLNARDGAGLWEHPLPSPALPGSLLVDRRGRVIVVLRDGGVVCFGGYEAMRDRISALVKEASDPSVGRRRAINLLLAALEHASDLDARTLLVEQLKELGTDVQTEARKVGRIVDFRLLGPVPWDHQENPTDKVLVGEPDVDLTKEYSVDGATLRWQDYAADTLSAGIDLTRIYRRNTNVAAYAYAEVRLDKDQDLLLKIGSDDGFKCWFNGREAGRFDGARAYQADQNVLKVKGVRGVNRILLKITQGAGGWAFGARLTDAANVPIDLNVE